MQGRAHPVARSCRKKPPQEFKGLARPCSLDKSLKPAVILYIRNPKEAEGKHDVIAQQCAIQHRKPFMDYISNAYLVYDITFTCGGGYVGHAGKHLNLRLCDWTSLLKAVLSGHLAIHINRINWCQCTSTFNDTKVLERFKDNSSREISEAFHLSERGERCISTLPIALYKSELRFMKRWQIGCFKQWYLI